MRIEGYRIRCENCGRNDARWWGAYPHIECDHCGHCRDCGEQL